MASPLDVVTALAVGFGQAILKPVRPEPGPVTERWGVGVGEFAARLPKMPGPLRGVARKLNQFGSVVVSPSGIEFDGDEVEWDRVTEIRTRRLVGYLLTDTIPKQVNRLPAYRFPGRSLVLTGAMQAALTAVAVVADPQLDRGFLTLYIPAEVHCRGLLRGKDIQPGFPASLVLADPSVRDCVEATARQHGIPVHQADDDALEVAARRAAAIRSAIGKAVTVAGKAVTVASTLAGQAGTRSSA